MVSIRLSRVGKKNHASFRFVVSDKRKDMYGPALEVLGWYDPHANPTTFEVQADRVQYWMSKGAQPSATVHNLLVGAGIIKGEKVVIAKVPKKEEPPATPVKVETPKTEAPKAEVTAEAEKVEVKPEAPKPEPKVETPAQEVKAEEKPAEAPKAEEKKEAQPAA